MSRLHHSIIPQTDEKIALIDHIRREINSNEASKMNLRMHLLLAKAKKNVKNVK